MWYEINVSKDGKHHFATHKRSIDNLKKAVEIRDQLKQTMPESEGYKYTITRYETIGIVAEI